MFKRNKIFKSIALIGLLVFLLAGCNKAEDKVIINDSNTINETQNQQDLETTKPDETKQEEPEVPEQKVPKVSFEKINLKWEATNAFGEGLIGFKDPGTELWGYSDYDGNVVIESKYSNVLSFKNGVASVNANMKNFQIDRQENVVEEEESNVPSEIKDTSFNSIYKDEPLIFDRATKYGYFKKGINDEPETVIKDENSNIVLYVDDIKKIYPDFTGIGISDNYISVMWIDGYEEKFQVTTAIIDYDLNVIIEPNKYSYVIELDMNHFLVANIDRTYGIIDKTGKALVEMSNTTVELMLDYRDYNKTGSEGYLAFNSKQGLSYTNLIYNYNIINNTGKNLILLVDTINNNIQSAKIYDLDKDEVIGYIPEFNNAAAADKVYLLPNVILFTDSMPHVCYDYNGNVIEQTVFPEYGYHVEDVELVDENTAVVQLEGHNRDQYMYIKISKK